MFGERFLGSFGIIAARSEGGASRPGREGALRVCSVSRRGVGDGGDGTCVVGVCGSACGRVGRKSLIFRFSVCVTAVLVSLVVQHV